MKHFIITVDTEGDNLWSWHEGMSIYTDNTLYLHRFQELCNKYGFKPVYLSNYEMLMDDRYVTMVKEWADKGLCEVGLHLHAWNTPPLSELKGRYNGNPYLIEYPEEVMEAKFSFLYNLFEEKMGFAPKSHRAGRWAMNKYYFDILKEFNIDVDCSYTPCVNWSPQKGRVHGGSDYSACKPSAFLENGVLEVPMSIIKCKHALSGSVKHRLRTLIKGDTIWLRPAISGIKEMKHLVDNLERKVDFLDFMIHSSELMPGGSPYFKDEKEIEIMYAKIESIFAYVHEKGYQGYTLAEYYNSHK